MTASKIATEDTRPLLEKARSAMRGLHAVETGLADVTTRLRQARATVRPEEAVLDVALDAVLAGDPVPDDVGAQVLKIRRSNEMAFASAGILGPLERGLRERLLAVHRERADDALQVLAVELRTLLAEAAPVLGQLDGVNDADDAIAADRVQPWRQAVAMAARYAELRQAQRILVSAAVTPQSHTSDRVSGEARALVDDFGHVVDADRHYPEVGTDVNRSEVRIGESRIFAGRLVTSDHSDRPVRPRPWLTGDVITDLRFACRADVRAWVPVINELTRARDDHRKRTEAAARAAAERLPGDEPEPRLRTDRRMPPPGPELLSRLAREELGEPA